MSLINISVQQDNASEKKAVSHKIPSGRGGRADFVLDLMEPMRPIVDRNVLKFVQEHTFHPMDFTIRSDGVCRLNPEMAKYVVRHVVAEAQTTLRSLGHPLSINRQIMTAHRKRSVRRQLQAVHPGPPSKTLVALADDLSKLSQYPLLDAGCGFGRNAFAFAARGLRVVCADNDPDCLNALIRATLINNGREGGRLYPILADLKHSRWPFTQNCFGAIICVHFLDTELFDAFRSSLVPGGYLYIETFGAHGRNYLDLPKAGQLRNLLSRYFKLAFYQEKSAGPRVCQAVSVRLLGIKL